MNLNTADIENPLLEEFLNGAGWRNAAITPIAGDASSRSYYRVADQQRRAVLMSAPPAMESASCPPDADADERRRLGYNASARLAGPNLNAFVAIAKMLRNAGIAAPEIFAADPKTGFALIEDLGDDLFAKVVTQENEREMYEHAIDVLSFLHADAPMPPSVAEYRMLGYDQLALTVEAELLTEWYWPLRKAEPADSSVIAEYRAATDELLGGLGPAQTPPRRRRQYGRHHALHRWWRPSIRGAP